MRQHRGSPAQLSSHLSFLSQPEAGSGSKAAQNANEPAVFFLSPSASPSIASKSNPGCLLHRVLYICISAAMIRRCTASHIFLHHSVSGPHVLGFQRVSFLNGQLTTWAAVNDFYEVGCILWLIMPSACELLVASSQQVACSSSSDNAFSPRLGWKHTPHFCRVSKSQNRLCAKPSSTHGP